ncbi:MAG: hypothetical protein IJ419_08125 [Agathobacter sp.]|nr:hypothetical protein [Agathobacter sp.]
MKKTLALLLAITMLVTLCVGCAPKKPESPPTTTPIVDTPSVETPIGDTEPTEPENVEKFEDIATKYIVLGVSNYREGKIIDINEQIDDALSDNNIDMMNKLITDMGQTVILIPYNDKYEYSDEYDGCTISSNDDEVEIHIMEYEGDVIDNGLVKEEELSYTNHSGAIYKSPVANDPIQAYIGFTTNKTIIGALGSNVDMIKTILDEMIVIESDFGEPTDIDTVLSALDNGVAATIPDYQSIISYINSEKYETATDEYGVHVLLSEELSREVHIELNDTYVIALDITECMNDDDIKEIKYIETKNLFGFGFYDGEDSAFYGFDKDTFAAVNIDGYYCPLDELYKVIQEIDVVKMTFNTELVDAVDDSIVQRDQSAADELGLAIQLGLVNDKDVYDSAMPYVCNDNVSCYVDSSSEPLDNAKVLYNCSHETDFEHYYYTDEARKIAGKYCPDGFMNGFTITFHPIKDNGAYVYNIADGIINEYIKPGGILYGIEGLDFIYHNGAEPDYENHGTLSTMESTYLYNRIRATIGDYIEILSAHHQDVPLTIFVAIDGTNVHVESQFGGFTK